MLMLNINSAAKFVTLAMASCMLASSASAAPILNPNSGGGDSLPAIDCVKIQGDITRETTPAIQGEQIRIKIDVSGCDPSLTVTLVSCEHHEDTLKLADVVRADQKEYKLAINTQPNTLATLNTGNIASTTTGLPKYQIQADATSKSGTERTASFNIAATASSRSEMMILLHPSTDLLFSRQASSESSYHNSSRPSSYFRNPRCPSCPQHHTLSMALALNSTSSHPRPHIPNTSLEIIDPSTLVNPSGPNQAARGDLASPKVIQESKKQLTSAEVFSSIPVLVLQF
ncbi:hypothetical protein BG015_007098 [Linnemannia schmuckeri]|uniref:Uncharacterized protein n=1 Tax=Linnemannia schmuckeri TaxID=64567 RepID=A0A9P5VBP6_9FUNG|nr:hypothetical protein BG015_007098 [Linnemannia schmuckeri]